MSLPYKKALFTRKPFVSHAKGLYIRLPFIQYKIVIYTAAVYMYHAKRFIYTAAVPPV